MKLKINQLKKGDIIKIPEDSDIKILRTATERTEFPSYINSYEVVSVNYSGGNVSSVRIKDYKDATYRIEKRHLEKEVNCLGVPGNPGQTGTTEKAEEKPEIVKLSELNQYDKFKFSNDQAVSASDENLNLSYLDTDESYIVLGKEGSIVKICTSETYEEWQDLLDEWENGDDEFEEEPEIESYFRVFGSFLVNRIEDDFEVDEKPRLDESTKGSVELGQSFEDFTLRCEASLKEHIAALTSKAFDAALVEAIQREVEFVAAAPVEFRKNLHPSVYQSNDSFYINLFKGMADVDDRRKCCIRDANALVLTYAEFRQVVNLVLTEKKKAGEKAEILLLPKREDEVENMELTALEHFMFIKMNNRGTDDAALAILWTLTPQEKPTLSIGL